MFLRPHRVPGLFANATNKIFVLALVFTAAVFLYQHYYRLPSKDPVTQATTDALFRDLHQHRDKCVALMKGLSTDLLVHCVAFEQSARSQQADQAHIHRDRIKTDLKKDLPKHDVELVKTQFRNEARELLQTSRRILENMTTRT